MDAVFERDGEQIGASLREGGEQEHGILHVGDGVGTRILRGKDAAGFFGREALLGDGEQQRPLPFRADADDLGFGFARHAGDGEAAHPAGGGVVGMVLAAGSFADDLGIGPAQTAEVTARAMPASRAAADEPQPLPMGMSLLMRRDRGVIC